MPKSTAALRKYIFWTILSSLPLIFALPGWITASRHGPRDSKRIALTFDDGPNPPYTSKQLALLRKFSVRATFFFLGRNIEMHRATALEAVQAGHEIGNHSYDHARLAWRTPGRIGEEIDRTDSLVRSLGYRGPIPFRSPFGQRFGFHAWVLLFTGRQNVLYDVEPVPPDYFRGDPGRMAESALERARGGSILLFHDGEGIRAEALDATAQIIPQLLEKGFVFVTVSELLQLDGSEKASRL